MDHQTLRGWDYVVLGLTLLISLIIGIYFRFTGGKQKTSKEFFRGDQSQRVLPVAVSLMASSMSAVTLLGVTAEVYMYGTLFITIITSYTLFYGIAAYLYLPVFFKLQATSAYEYLERRFGSGVRLAASLLYSTQMLLYTGVVLYAPAIALEALTGLSRNVSILVVGIVCTLYSAIGGIKAVIYTDVFQSILMYAALISVISAAAWNNGGLLPIWNIAQKKHRIQFFDFSLDPTVRHTTWSLFLGGGFTFLSLFAVNQTQVQRYLTMKDYRSAVKALWLSLPFLFLLLIACSFAGLAIFSVYYKCDPLMSGRISSLDQLMPLFVIDTMGEVPGLPGLFAAGLFSASLSTVSACVNSLAAVTIEDYIKPWSSLMTNSHLASSTALVKGLVLVYGLACMMLAFMAQYLGGLLQAGLSIMGIAGGPLLGTFTLGMFLPSANEPGALAGITSGLITALWVGFGQPKPKPIHLPLSTSACSITNNFTGHVPTSSPHLLYEYPYMYRISYLLYVVISCAVTLVVGSLISWLATFWGYQPSHENNPDLFTPPIAKYLKHKQHKKEMALHENMLELEVCLKNPEVN